jgi:hypothetical protein
VIIRSLVAALAALLLLLPAAASASEPPDPGDTVLTASPLTAGAAETGVLATPDDADWYRVDAPGPATAIQVSVRRLNAGCEVWARLISLDGLIFDQVDAARAETRSLTTVTPSGGPYFIALDHGPTATCGGGRYSVGVTVADAAPSLRSLTSPRAAKGLSHPNWYVCQQSTGMANSQAVRINRTTRALRRAHGRTRKRLLRSLRGARRQYRTARRAQRLWCY